MQLTRRDLAERCGLAARTLRNYTALGLLPPPSGHGLAAVYGDEHLVRAIAISRMRAGGVSLAQVAEDVRDWTTAKFKRYVADTEPAKEATPGAAPASPVASRELPLLEGEPVPAEQVRRLTGGRRSGGASGASGMQVAEDSELPDAAAWSIYPLLSGMALMVDIDAPEAVKRLASEILGKYGTRRRA
jgi:DNA-binding transcriptional MerR regulator